MSAERKVTARLYNDSRCCTIVYSTSRFGACVFEFEGAGRSANVGIRRNFWNMCKIVRAD